MIQVRNAATPETVRSLARAAGTPQRPDSAAPILPPRATTDGTHRRLQEAALILFAKRGYNGISIRDLAEAAGITTSSIYTHVSAKQDFLIEVMLLGHEEHHDRLRNALLSASPDPRSQISALVTAHVNMHLTYPLLARVCNNEIHALSAENAPRVNAVRTQNERFFLDVVSRGMEDGTFRTQQPWLAVAAIAGMGIRVAEWYSPDSQFDPNDVEQTYTEFALKILS